jgi:hypothetical protein
MEFRPYAIKLLRRIGKYDIGTVGTVVSDCGCIGNARIVVMINDNDEIIMSKHLTKGYEHYKVL